MKALWQKYKVWLLIGALYSVFFVVKAFKALKSVALAKLVTMKRA